MYDECKNINKNELKSISPRPSTSKYVPYSKNMQFKTKQSRGKNYKMLENWYNGVLSEMTTVSNKNKIVINEDNYIVECYCNKTPPISTIVYCINCSKGQHPECVHFEPKPLQEVPFLCADCWAVNDKLQCRATLIVVPQSILNQWIEEVIFYNSFFFNCLFVKCINFIILILDRKTHCKTRIKRVYL